MIFNLLISGPLYSSQSAYSALKFARAAVSKGHTISQVFFYQDGVSNANQLSNPLSDEFDSVSTWQAFAKENGIPLVACISSAERRGIVDDELASEVSSFAGNLAQGFEIAGLGTLHEASISSDRTVTFK